MSQKPRVIFASHVDALFPPSGPIRALVYAEAPGPNGADKSGIPFLGDEGGAEVYKTLLKMDLVTFFKEGQLIPLREILRMLKTWDGQDFKSNRVVPVLSEVALSNAFPQCPTIDGVNWKEPNAQQLQSAQNVQRIQDEITRAKNRSSAQKIRLITLGRPAEKIFQTLNIATYGGMCHPSDRGIINSKHRLAAFNPPHGDINKKSCLKRAWRAQFEDLLT